MYIFYYGTSNYHFFAFKLVLRFCPETNTLVVLFEKSPFILLLLGCIN